jgi:TRAP transporter TAXI family solute receptor
MTLSRLLVVAAAAGIAWSPAGAQVYSMGSNPQGSLIFSASAAIAKVAQEKLGLQIRVQPMAGSTTYVPLLNSGELDFGLTNVDDARSSYHGTGNFAGKPNANIRIMTVLFPLTLSFIVVNDSPIKSVKDLKGMRVPSEFPGQATAKVVQNALLASAGLTMADVKPVPVVNLFKGIEALGAGKSDAAATGPAVAQVQQAHVDLASRGGVRFLSIDSSSEALAAMRKFVPVRTMVVQPAPHNVGVVAPTTFMTYSMYASTNAKVPEEVVYRLVKMLHQSHDDLKKVTPVLNNFDPRGMSEQVDVPWHPGAIKFYTEIGQWPPSS